MNAGKAAIASVFKGDVIMNTDISGRTYLGTGAALDAIIIYRKIKRSSPAVCLLQHRPFKESTDALDDSVFRQLVIM